MTKTQNEALRPQPSGETREYQIAAVMTALNSFHVLSGRVTSTQAEHVLASLDALSARPLASGGQHSGGVTADSLTHSVTDETMRALLSCKDVGTGRAHLAAIILALLSAPARAEAQHEGAAGSVCAFCFGSGKDAGSQFNACPDCGGKGRHPSPPPAADEDRVRELERALEPFATYPLATLRDGNIAPDEYQLTGRTDEKGIFRTVTNADFQRARAALKSTAAKEGEKK